MRADGVSRHVRTLVVGSLLRLSAVTVGIAPFADSVGARQPVVIASIAVAIAVLIGRPALMAVVRHHATQTERP